MNNRKYWDQSGSTFDAESSIVLRRKQMFGDQLIYSAVYDLHTQLNAWGNWMDNSVDYSAVRKDLKAAMKVDGSAAE